MLLPTLLFVAIVGVVATLLARAGGRRFALALGAWLVLALLVASTGVLSSFEARPPRLLFVLGTAIVLVITTVRARVFDHVPRAWPIALQTMRVPIELVLFLLFRAGSIPEHMTFEGRNFDVLVGLTAPFIAWAVARGHLGRRGVIAWNVASLGLLANIIVLAITAIPGPLHRPWPGPPNTIVATVPWVLLPVFLVPVALLGHVVSLRQSLQTWAAQAPLPEPTPTVSVTSSAALKHAEPACGAEGPGASAITSPAESRSTATTSFTDSSVAKYTR